jgi:hypothetical protein
LGKGDLRPRVPPSASLGFPPPRVAAEDTTTLKQRLINYQQARVLEALPALPLAAPRPISDDRVLPYAHAQGPPSLSLSSRLRSPGSRSQVSGPSSSANGLRPRLFSAHLLLRPPDRDAGHPAAIEHTLPSTASVSRPAPAAIRHRFRDEPRHVGSCHKSPAAALAVETLPSPGSATSSVFRQSTALFPALLPTCLVVHHPLRCPAQPAAGVAKLPIDRLPRRCQASTSDPSATPMAGCPLVPPSTPRPT